MIFLSPYLAEKDFSLLEKCLHEALAAAKAYPNSEGYGKALYHLAVLYQSRGGHPEAFTYSKELLAWIKQHKLRDDPSWQIPLTIAGHSLFCQGMANPAKLFEAFDAYWHQLLAARRRYKPHDTIVITLIGAVANTALQLRIMDGLDKLMTPYMKKVDLSNVKGLAATNTSWILNNWGVSFRFRARFEEAAEAHTIAVMLDQDSFEPNDDRARAHLQGGPSTTLSDHGYTFAKTVFNLIVVLERLAKHNEASEWRERYPYHIMWVEKLDRPIQDKLKELDVEKAEMEKVVQDFHSDPWTRSHLKVVERALESFALDWDS